MTTKTETETTIPTMYRAYSFDVVRNPGDAEAYAALCALLTGQGLRMFHVWADPKERTRLPSQDTPVELETAHLFDNQWNTAPMPGLPTGARVFDWYEGIYPNCSLRSGHYLDQTAAMRAIRRNVSKCGYCGKQEPTGAYVFCPHCLDSEYLKASDLKLTRMVSIDQTGPGRTFPELTPTELAEREPLYRQAKIHGATARGMARVAKVRADAAQSYANKVRNATAERDGTLWLADHCPGVLGNAIFYDHTGRWGFGWRAALEGGVLSDLLDIVSEFPFPYDITCADGRTLSGG